MDQANQTTQVISKADLPAGLRNIEYPPVQLYVHAGDDQTFEKLMSRPRVAIVGSRMVTTYGEMVTAKLASELAAHGVVIISGLAIGVDGVAHRAALEVGGLTMAVLPGSVEQIHPRSHNNLARQLVASGGALVSEYPSGAITFKQNFIARNRIVAGLADILLITEATEKSGTMHTARFALAQGSDVMAVPGSITSPLSEGTNNLIKAGAIPVTVTADVLHRLNITPATEQGNKQTRQRGANHEEQQLLDLLERGIHQGNELLEKSGFSVDQFNHHLTMLELTAKIRPLGANQWSLR